MLPVLYSFRRCPYAMRARMAIYTADVSVELREVVLRDKPEELLALSAKATVPVLQLPDGAVLDESRDIMLWALAQNDPGQWISSDPDVRELTGDLIDANDVEFKSHLDRYKYPDRFEGVSPEHHRAQGQQFLQRLDALLAKQAWLAGEGLSLADVAVFPFVRQFAHVDEEWFKQLPYSALQRWLAALTTSPLFLDVMQKYKPWRRGDATVVFP